MTNTLRPWLDSFYQLESRRILATLIRLLGDFDLAEEAMHEAFSIALQQWEVDGIPANPRAWMVSTARFKAIDQIRRRAKFDTSFEDVADDLAEQLHHEPDYADETIEDDRLRLIFTCCHPSLSPEAQLALTLREVCGLSTEEVASAFLSTTPTMAQRIVRAKTKIRDAKIPYEVPQADQLQERLHAVLQVIYLVFNEGYSASTGEALIRQELCNEAIRLGRLLVQLLPEPEAVGLLALMLLNDSRQAARCTPNGDLILLADQNRTLWNQAQIREGCQLVLQALATRRFGAYTLQAAISAVHAEAPSVEKTDWIQIVGLYDALLEHTHSPVIALNRAVAVAMRDGPQAGLALVDELMAQGHLQDYHLAHATRADLYRRMGHVKEARDAYQDALRLPLKVGHRKWLYRFQGRMAKKNAHAQFSIHFFPDADTRWRASSQRFHCQSLEPNHSATGNDKKPDRRCVEYSIDEFQR